MMTMMKSELILVSIRFNDNFKESNKCANHVGSKRRKMPKSPMVTRKQQRPAVTATMTRQLKMAKMVSWHFAQFFLTVRPQTRSTVWFHSRLIPRLLYLLLKPISFSAPAETAEEAVGTVEEDQPAATTDDATVAESTASVDTASKTRVNTLVSLILLIID